MTNLNFTPANQNPVVVTNAAQPGIGRTVPTLAAWNNDYHDSLTIKTREISSRTIKNNIVKYIGDKPLNQISGNDISKIYATLKIKGISNSTIFVTDTYLNRLLKAAVSKGYISKNPIDMIDRPVSLPHDICPYSDEEREKIHEAIKASPLSTLFILVSEQGLRAAEALALSWDDVDFKQNVIRIHQAFANLVSHPSFKDISAKGQILMMTAETANALKEEKKRQDKKAQLAGSRWNNKHNLVFTNAFGYPLQHPYVSAECRNMKNRTHLADFSLSRLAVDYADRHREI